MNDKAVFNVLLPSRISFSSFEELLDSLLLSTQCTGHLERLHIIMRALAKSPHTWVEGYKSMYKNVVNRSWCFNCCHLVDLL